mmetsp:Transcript_973/g.1741  ORF Transcript_973/g.1741 Transcript_973/m.1741 type:complete len:88 (+) Transcript_973:822-1085(+)
MALNSSTDLIMNNSRAQTGFDKKSHQPGLSMNEGSGSVSMSVAVVDESNKLKLCELSDRTIEQNMIEVEWQDRYVSDERRINAQVIN